MMIFVPCIANSIQIALYKCKIYTTTDRHNHLAAIRHVKPITNLTIIQTDTLQKLTARQVCAL